jgi:AhpD family alkylhydroperoxidase
MSKRRGDRHADVRQNHCPHRELQLPALRTTSRSFGEQTVTKRFDVKAAMTPKGRRMSDEVEISNHRADATQNESLIGMARMGADAFGYTAELRIDRGLAELLRLRVTQLINCSYCLNLRYQAARGAGVPRSTATSRGHSSTLRASALSKQGRAAPSARIRQQAIHVRLCTTLRG